MNRDLGTLRLETETIRAQIDPSLRCARLDTCPHEWGAAVDTARVAAVGGMLLASAVFVAISGGLALAAGAPRRRADSAFSRVPGRHEFADVAGFGSPSARICSPVTVY